MTFGIWPYVHDIYLGQLGRMRLYLDVSNEKAYPMKAKFWIQAINITRKGRKSIF